MVEPMPEANLSNMPEAWSSPLPASLVTDRTTTSSETLRLATGLSHLFLISLGLLEEHGC
jgi:hypothetical protein